MSLGFGSLSSKSFSADSITEISSCLFLSDMMVNNSHVKEKKKSEFQPDIGVMPLLI